MIESLFLCGTVHLDLAGPGRLKKALELIKPDYIAVESSPNIAQDIIEKKKNRREYDETIMQKLKELNLKGISTEGVRMDTLEVVRDTVGYEVYVPSEFAEKTGAKVGYIEDSERVERIAKNFMDNLLNDPSKAAPFIEILKIPPKTLGKVMDICYIMVGGKEEDLVQCTERNKFFAEKIRTLEGRVLAVVGAAHIYGSEPTLPSLLRDYNQVSFGLNDVDSPNFEKLFRR